MIDREYCDGYRLEYTLDVDFVKNGLVGGSKYYNSRLKLWLAAFKYIFSKKYKEVKLYYND